MEVDLFSEPAPAPKAKPRVWKIGELTREVRRLLESSLGEVWVQGEICNYRKQSSGHHYFGLKDERAILSCVLFRSSAPARLEIADGMCVQARGEITVYEARGQYQLTVNLLQPAGQGLLQAKFEALKRKLEAEGLFGRKRPLPKWPGRIGLVTSPTGAAVHDFLNIARRRAPWVPVVINPVRVQGEGAAAEIAAAIREFNSPAFREHWPVDVLVVCRGGGSMDDLWAFNEEVVARAIFESEIPVVSAVGHEIDFTIADFVADLRAPTPSAAAELVVPDGAMLSRHLAQHQGRLHRELTTVVARCRAHLESLTRSPAFRSPKKCLADRAQRLDLAQAALQERVTFQVRAEQERLASFWARVRQHRPDQVLALRKLELLEKQRTLRDTAANQLGSRVKRMEALAGLLRVLSPVATLERGYSITLDAQGATLRKKLAVKPGDKVQTRLADGTFDSVVQ